MPIASSLALALVALVQQAPDPRILQKHARALAKEDVEARAAAETYLDGLSTTYLGFARSVTAFEAPEVRDAVRRRLPHALWWGVMDGTIGDVRRRERELLGDPPVWTMASLSKAGARLLEGGKAERLAGLRLLARAPASDPAALVPGLDDVTTAHAAATAIARADEALALREALRRFLEGPDALARQMASVLAELGSPDLTPRLAELLRTNPSRASDVVSLLEKIGDERAEEALIEWLPRAPVPYGVLRTLSLLGGPRAAAAIRRYRDGLDAGDANRRWATRALARLREPGLSRELLDILPWDPDLARLGDRTILDEVVARVRGGRLKIQDRRRALELVGILGGEAHVDLLLEHLKDDRFKDAAAAALAEIGDPRAARPLMEALSLASYGTPFVQALSRLPLSDAEAPLLSLLDDPDENPGAMSDAIALAGRAGGPRMKERLSALLTGRAWSCALPAAQALGPLLTPEDRDALKTRPAEKDARGRLARALALALAGDAPSVAACVRAWREGGLADRRGIEEVLPLDGEAWIRAVESELRDHPAWFEGAEQLALRGRPAGRDLLLARLRGQDPSARKRAVVALAALGDATGLREVLESGDLPPWTPKEESALLKGVDADFAERLRLWTWMNLAQGNAWPARVLAAKRDLAMGAYYRRALRRDAVDNDVEAHSDLRDMAEAAADLGMSTERITFLRLLRSRAPTGRVLGARALARLDGRAALPHLVPLLDDGEALPAGGRVRDRVVDVLEGLAGRAFHGPSRTRVEAAREWSAK